MAENPSVDLDDVFDMSMSLGGSDDLFDANLGMNDQDMYVPPVERAIDLSTVTGLQDVPLMNLSLLTSLDVSQTPTPMLSALNQSNRLFSSPFQSVQSTPQITSKRANITQRSITSPIFPKEDAMQIPSIPSIGLYATHTRSYKKVKARSLYRSFQPLPKDQQIAPVASVCIEESTRAVVLSRAVGAIYHDSVMPLLQRCIKDLDTDVRDHIEEMLPKYPDHIFKYPGNSHLGLQLELKKIQSWPESHQICVVNGDIIQASGCFLVNTANQKGIYVDGEIESVCNLGEVLFFTYSSISKSAYICSCTVHDLKIQNTTIYNGKNALDKKKQPFITTRGMLCLAASSMLQIWGVSQDHKPILVCLNPDTLDIIRIIKTPSMVSQCQPLYSLYHTTIHIIMSSHKAILRVSSSVLEWVVEKEYKMDSYTQSPIVGIIDEIFGFQSASSLFPEQGSLISSPMYTPYKSSLIDVKSPPNSSILSPRNTKFRFSILSELASVPTLINTSILIQKDPNNNVPIPKLQKKRIVFSNSVDRHQLTQQQAQLEKILLCPYTCSNHSLDPATMFQYNEQDEMTGIHGEEQTCSLFPTLHIITHLPGTYLNLPSNSQLVTGSTSGLIHISQFDKPMQVPEYTNTQDNYRVSEVQSSSLLFSILAHTPYPVTYITNYKDGFISADTSGKIIVWEFAQNRFIPAIIVNINDICIEYTAYGVNDMDGVVPQEIIVHMVVKEDIIYIQSTASQYIQKEHTLQRVSDSPSWCPSIVYTSEYGIIKASDIMDIVNKRYKALSTVPLFDTMLTTQVLTHSPPGDTQYSSACWVIQHDVYNIILYEHVSCISSIDNTLFIAVSSGIQYIYTLPTQYCLGHIDLSTHGVEIAPIHNMYVYQQEGVTFLSLEQSIQGRPTVHVFVQFGLDTVRLIHTWSIELPISVKYVYLACGCFGLHVRSLHSSVVYPISPCSIHTQLPKIYTTNVLIACDYTDSNTSSALIHCNSVYFNSINSRLSIHTEEEKITCTIENTQLEQAKDAFKQEISSIVQKYKPLHTQNSLLQSLYTRIDQLQASIQTPGQLPIGTVSCSSCRQHEALRYSNIIYTAMHPSYIPVYIYAHYPLAKVAQHIRDTIQAQKLHHTCANLTQYKKNTFLHEYHLIPQYISQIIHILTHSLSNKPIYIPKEIRQIHFDVQLVQQFLQGKLETRNFHISSLHALLQKKPVQHVVERILDKQVDIKLHEIEKVDTKLQQFLQTRHNKATKGDFHDINDDLLDTQEEEDIPRTKTQTSKQKNRYINDTNDHRSAIEYKSVEFSEKELLLLNTLHHMTPNTKLEHLDIQSLYIKLHTFKQGQEEILKQDSIQTRKLQKMIADVRKVLDTGSMSTSVCSRAEARVQGDVYSKLQSKYNKKSTIRDHLIESVACKEQLAEQQIQKQVKQEDVANTVASLKDEYHHQLALNITVESQLHAETLREQEAFLQVHDITQEQERITLQIAQLEADIKERKRLIEYQEEYV